MAHAFNPSTQERQRQSYLFEFEASLVYRANARTGFKATEKPCLENAKQTKQNNLPSHLPPYSPEKSRLSKPAKVATAQPLLQFLLQSLRALASYPHCSWMLGYKL